MTMIGTRNARTRVLLATALALAGCAANVTEGEGEIEDVGSGAQALVADSEFATAMSLGRNADGRLELFYTGLNDFVMYHKWQTQIGGSWNGNGVPLGTTSNKGLRVASILNASNRLEVFYVGTNNRIYRTVQSASGGWSAEQDMGGAGFYLAVAKNKNGTLELFYIGTNNVLYHNYQNTNGSWSGEQLLGTATNKAQQLAVGTNTSGRLEVFYIGMSGVLFHNWQTAPNSGWNGEARLAGSTTAKRLSITNDFFTIFTPGPLEVVYVGSDDTLYHVRQKDSEAGWNAPERLGATSKKAKMVFASYHPGSDLGATNFALEIFYCGMDDVLYHVRKPRGGAWSDHALLGSSTTKCRNIVAGQIATGSQVIYTGLSNRLWEIHEVGTNRWSGEKAL